MMNRNFIGLFLLMFFLIACTSKKTSSNQSHQDSPSKKITNLAFAKILEDANVEGAILIYDWKARTFYSNDFKRSETGFIPASTFKIPNSLIALETGVIANDSTLIEWDGQERSISNWNQDLIFKEAFHYSCVPCYQAIAREVGTEKMKSWLAKFDYGEMVFDTSNVDLFWLEGDSKISQLEQIEFLMKFYHSQLPISKRTESIAKRMMQVEKNETYSLLAKTGRSVSNVSWYVGYLEKGNNVYFFATNMSAKGSYNSDARKETTMTAFKELGIVK